MTAANDLPTDFDRAARRFFTPPLAVTPPGGSTGYSGSQLARVEAAGRAWCLRRWPAGYPAGRLRFVHRVLRHSRARGFAGVPALATTPAGETIAAVGGARYDAQAWMPGAPLDAPPPGGESLPNAARALPTAQLAALAAFVARFHRSTRDLPARPGDAEDAPARRLAARAADLRRRAPELDAAARRLDDAGERALARHWLALLPRALVQATARLVASPGASAPTPVICHGDLWPRHVHFLAGDACGLLDFEGIARGGPALDLAHLLLHFGGWHARDAVVHAYEAVLPLTDADRAMILPLAACDLVGEGLWALGALTGGDLNPRQRAAHRANLATLLGPLGAVVRELAG